MTFKQAQERAFLLGEQAAKRVETRIAAKYAIAFRETEKELNSLYALLKARGISPADRYNYVIKIGRLRQIQTNIVNIFDKEYAGIMTDVRFNSMRSVVNNYYANQYALSWFSPTSFRFNFVDSRAVNLSVWWTSDVWNRIKVDALLRNRYKAYPPDWGLYRQTPIGPVRRKHAITLKSLLLNNKKKQLGWVKNAITQSLIQGKNFIQTSLELRNAFGKSKRNTDRVVRTEGMRNLSAGQYLNHQTVKGQGIILDRRWTATFDAVTRSQSATMDGQLADRLSDLFTYPNGAVSQYPGGSGVPQYDIEERCTVVEIVPGQEPQLRTGRNPVKEQRWREATNKERKNKRTKEGIELFSPSQQNETMTYRTFNTWAEENNLVQKNGLWVKAQ